MFESAEIGNKIEKDRYEKLVPKLRAALLAAQHKFHDSGKSVVIVVGGVEGAGKAQLVDLLLSWLDARGVQVHALDAPSDEEAERPRYWRYWRILPPAGKTAVILGSWYTEPIVGRVFKRVSRAEFNLEMDRVIDFERMLAEEGVVLVKLWLHLSKKVQKERLKRLEKDRLTRWRVSELDWKFHKKYDRFRKVSEEALRKTGTAESPWTILEASDHRYRDVSAVQAVLKTFESIGQRAAVAPKSEAPPKPKKVNVLSALRLGRKLDDGVYKERLREQQSRLNHLTRRLRAKGRSMILAFEGPDAAGKGGAIRRLTAAMDARSYRVISTAAPTEEERSHPYLWRFWRDLPRLGRTTIYDRSWYGRVLVERLEGFAAPKDWRRAYKEINAFEEQLVDFGTLVLKFWLALSPEEQMLRFKSRQITPYKQYKLTEEDWRNREKWDGYVAAACDMIEKTSTESAPWILVEAVDKNWARIKVLTSVCDALEKALD